MTVAAVNSRKSCHGINEEVGVENCYINSSPSIPLGFLLVRNSRNGRKGGTWEWNLMTSWIRCSLISIMFTNLVYRSVFFRERLFRILHFSAPNTLLHLYSNLLPDLKENRLRIFSLSCCCCFCEWIRRKNKYGGCLWKYNLENHMYRNKLHNNSLFWSREPLSLCTVVTLNPKLRPLSSPWSRM